MIIVIKSNYHHCERSEAISVLKTGLPQICSCPSSAEEETNGPQETRQEDQVGPRRT